MSKTALLFSPEGGNVNSVTIKLGELIGNEKVDIIPAREASKKDVEDHAQIIFLGSTVGADHWSNETIVDEWIGFFAKMDKTVFEDKKVAIVGLGNSVLYPEHFADGMARVYKEITERGGRVSGFTDPEGYSFTDSEALNDEGLFCGLPIDEDNEDELTDERLEKWISSLKPEFEF